MQVSVMLSPFGGGWGRFFLTYNLATLSQRMAFFFCLDTKEAKDQGLVSSLGLLRQSGFEPQAETCEW
jgi:hypothetical protein